jgi:putative transposase
MSFWRTYYHLVWGTKNRFPTLDDESARIAEQTMRKTSGELGLIFYGYGFMPEHVHVVLGIPPRHAVSEVVRRLKGRSSHALAQASKDAPEPRWFGWQSEYGVTSFDERSLDQIVRYVERQKEHHLTGDLMPAFETLGSNSPGGNASSSPWPTSGSAIQREARDQETAS